MTNCRNEQEIIRALEPKLKIIVQVILEEIQKANVEAINEIVYEAGEPTEYPRSFEFRDKAWGIDKPIMSIGSKEVKGEFYYAPYADGYSREQHASYLDPSDDMRFYLAEIIYEGLAGHIFGEGFWTQKRNAWTKLLQVVGSKEMDKWIKRGASKAGLKITIP